MAIYRGVGGTGDTTRGESVEGPNTTITQLTGIEGPIKTPTYIEFNQTADPILTKGQLGWNSEDGTLDIGLNLGGVILQIGEETLYRVVNMSGSTITHGTLVMADGTVGNSGKIKIVPWNGTADPIRIMGITTEDIPDETNGYVTHFGKVRGIQTNGGNYSESWVNGDILYAGPTGGLTKVKPSAPKTKTTVAIVVSAHPTNGTLFVRPSLSSNLGDDDLVQLTSLSDNDVIAYNSTSGRFENVSAALVSGSLSDGDYGDITVSSGGTVWTIDAGAVDNNKIANSTIDLTAKVTGTLPVANGGTGTTTLTANNVLLGNGTSAPLTVAPGTSGNVLTSNGTTWTSTQVSSITQNNSSVAVTDTGSNGTVAITTEGTERMRITATGNVIINDNPATSDGGFELLSNSYHYARFSTYGDHDYGGSIDITKSRGTKASPSNVVSGDYVGDIRWTAQGATNFTASISTQVTATPATGSAPSALIFATQPAGTNATALERMRITANGKVGIGTGAPTNLVDIQSNSAYFDDFSSATYDQDVILTGPANEYPKFGVQAWGGAASGGSATPYQQGEVSLLRQRGTLSSPLPTQNGDQMGALNFRGWNSTLNSHSGVAILGLQTGAATSTGTPAALLFFTNNGSNRDGTFNFEINATGDALVKGAGGLGYGTGTGGSVTQASSRTTGVTLNKTNGQITLVSAAGSTTAASFTVTNSTVAATDTIIVNQATGTNLYDIMVTAVAAGSFRITQRTTGGTTTEAPVFNFAVIKAVTS